MRGIFILALAIAGAPACSDSGGANNSAGRAARRVLPDPSNPGAIISLRAGAAGACTPHFNGEAVDRDGLARRSREIMDTAVSIAGGVERMRGSEIPYLRLEVASGLTYACVAPVIAVLNELGYPRVGIKPDETAPSAHFANFPMTEVGAAPPSVTLAIGPDGAMDWNGQAVDLAALAARVRTLPNPGGEPGAPGVILVVPAREAPFASLYEAVKTIRQEGVEPDLGVPPPPAAR